MTIEQKAQRYDEAIKVAENIYRFSSDPAEIKRIEQIFPELIESEEEKIRKELIHYFTEGIEFLSLCSVSREQILARLEKQKVLTTEENLQGKEDVLWCIKQAKKNAKDENEMGTCWFAEKWLEKQSEKKSTIKMKTPEESLGVDSDTYNKIVDECIYDEQKPNDKVEPKFKVGDWVSGYYTNYKVMAVNSKGYVVEDTDGNKINILFENEKFHHLFTIADAKNGDVLSDGTTIFIFKDLLSDGSVMSYCDYDADRCESDAFCPLSMNLMCSKITPATKEQRDLLFQKMKEAGYGYWWGVENKELKQNPAEWSEEDELMLTSIIQTLKLTNGTAQMKIDWLKSIKERYNWKPSDEQIKVCKEVYADILSAKGFDLGTINSELNRLEEQLNKLKG